MTKAYSEDCQLFHRKKPPQQAFTVGNFLCDIIDCVYYIPTELLSILVLWGLLNVFYGVHCWAFFVSIWEFVFKTCRIKTPFGVFNFNSTTIIHLESLRQPCNFFTNMHFLPNEFRVFPPVSCSTQNEIAFCFQNCSDLLWEKNVSNSDGENFWISRLKAQNLQILWAC